MKEMEKRLSKWGVNQWMVFGGIVLLAAISSSLMINRFLNAEGNGSPLLISGSTFGSAVFKMAIAQPLFGFGPGTFPDVYPFFFGPRAFGTPSTPSRTMNTYKWQRNAACRRPFSFSFSFGFCSGNFGEPWERPPVFKR